MFVFNIFVFNIPVKCASFLNKIWLPKKIEKAEMFKFVKTPAPLLPPGFSQFTLRQKAKPLL